MNGLLGFDSKKSEMNARPPPLVPGVSCEQVRVCTSVDSS